MLVKIGMIREKQFGEFVSLLIDLVAKSLTINPGWARLGPA